VAHGTTASDGTFARDAEVSVLVQQISPLAYALRPSPFHMRLDAAQILDLVRYLPESSCGAPRISSKKLRGADIRLPYGAGYSRRMEEGHEP
jgi:hypothetical protein